MRSPVPPYPPIAEDLAVSPPSEYRYTVLWNGAVVAAVAVVNGLTRGNQTLTPPAGGEVRPPSRHSGYTPISLERGVITDPRFLQWAGREWNRHATPEPGADRPAEGRQDLQLEVRDSAGEPTVRYDLYGCWPSVLTTGSEPAQGGGTSLAALRLEHQGWNRDARVAPRG